MPIPPRRAWAKVGGIRTIVYSNSLVIVMVDRLVRVWFAQSVNGWTSSTRADRRTATRRVVAELPRVLRLLGGDLPELAIGVPRRRLFAVLVIYLRQRGSPESKPVGASTRDATGAES